MSDSLDDRLSKQKTASEANRLAFLKANQERIAKIDAENFQNRVPRATEYFTKVRTDIVRIISELAKRKRQPKAGEAIPPFVVPKEFDGSKGEDRDIRHPDDTAHAVWADFVKWGETNGLSVAMSAPDGKSTVIRVSVG